MDTEERLAVLAACPLLSGVPDADLRMLAEPARLRRFRRGQLLFSEGDEADALLVVASGSLKVSSIGADGLELLLAVLERGDTAGELAVIDGGPRSASLSALTDAEVVGVPREAVLAGLARSPALSKAVLDGLAAVVRQLTGSAADLALLDIPHRVAKFVLSRVGDGGTSTTRLTQADMAAAVGASRQSLNAALQQFQRRGWIVVRPGRVELRDPVALRHYVGR